MFSPRLVFQRTFRETQSVQVSSKITRFNQPYCPTSARRASNHTRTMSIYSKSNVSTAPETPVENPSTSASHNAWSSPGPSAIDLRSDVVTTPTPSMLTAIGNCSLFDDVFQEDPTTSSLESFVASLAGKPAAVLVLSGTMGNQVAIRTHLQAPPHSIIVDDRSHIIRYEAGGAASLSGAMVTTVKPSNGRHLTLEDVKEHVVLSDDVHACPTKMVCLENTLNGTILPLEECRRISEWVRGHGIIMHLDGARLWEAVVAGAGELKGYCECFDTVSLCFSKGLGAPIGSILVGQEAFVKRARWVRKSIGGGMRQTGIIAAPARVAVEETFLGGGLQAAHVRAKKLGDYWESLGGKHEFPVETNMVWLSLKGTGVDTDEFIKLAESKGLRVMGERLVIHYQVTDEAEGKLKEVMNDVFSGKAKGEN
ncbi:hypothetical protein P152DRAFT_176002 [Eremomyces bilateralis CBS 781.70]|uniref:Aromatic amino acid beta-eliminating lyase/threonine aldolase domain-containing protein n=1 Tax=Eremomyces bilateralis CBS 781.70 TaxID=1392243 RepID=A0A6G1FT96_9PEZI|nr:uncharacterized protein P152DRAFT_176002 [Eremomyces bilateralis CBS 781.70]KAF1808912.1 hypothetical protein P152DRAFT_176002 [Eremomyces bilateralis CBS 781.70]